MLSGLATGVEFSLEGWPLLGIEFHAVHFRSWPVAVQLRKRVLDAQSLRVTTGSFAAPQTASR